MLITIFVMLMSISFLLVTLGLVFREHSELSLIGFTFLFLLSFVIIGEQLTTKTGTFTNSTFSYDTNYSGLNVTLLSASNETVTELYSPVILEGVLAHTIGYWLAIISVIGFVGIIIGLRGGYKK